MYKLVKRLAFYLTIALAVFFAVALWSGGEKIRWFGEKTGGAIKKSSEKLGEKADAIKEATDKTASRIKKLSGSGGEEPGDASETPKKNTEETESGKGKKDENKSISDSLHDLWHSIWKKVKTLIK